MLEYRLPDCSAFEELKKHGNRFLLTLDLVGRWHYSFKNCISHLK